MQGLLGHMLQLHFTRGVRAELLGIKLKPKYFMKCRECGTRGRKMYSPVCSTCYMGDSKCLDKWIRIIDVKRKM